MTKRLTDKQKVEIINFFSEGKTIDELAHKYKCTNLTITRNLKKYLGEQNYKSLINKNKSIKSSLIKSEESINTFENNNSNKNNLVIKDVEFGDKEFLQGNQFMEISPLNYEIDDKPQRELASVSIEQITLPKMVYMIVDKKIELEIKLLKDYPEWSFLPSEDLNRKTISIYSDLKIAKRFCNKEQKVIKVPNTDVFKIVAPILISRGISRIVSSEKLIAL